jgi:hypothetical protein
MDSLETPKATPARCQKYRKSEDVVDSLTRRFLFAFRLEPHVLPQRKQWCRDTVTALQKEGAFTERAGFGGVLCFSGTEITF